MELGLRNDVYRRPLATALDRLGLREGWRCVDVGAGGGDVSVALAEVVGRDGRVYAVDSDPHARDEVARTAAAHAQVVAITQSGEDLLLPEPVDLAFCRFLLMHVHDPIVVLRRMGTAVRPGGWVVAQEPVTSAGRVGGAPLSMPAASFCGGRARALCPPAPGRRIELGAVAVTLEQMLALPRRQSTRRMEPARRRALSERQLPSTHIPSTHI